MPSKQAKLAPRLAGAALRPGRHMSFNGPFLKRLVRLSGQAESVQAIAGYILLHSGHAKQLVHNWLVVLRAARSDRVLPLIYVANDVVQRAAARKLNVFIKEFGEVSALPASSAARARSGRPRPRYAVRSCSV